MKIDSSYRYLLNTNTGVVHDLANTQKSCQLEIIKEEHIYLFNDFFWDDAKKHGYTENCDKCMNPDG